MTIAEWSKETGLNFFTINNRIKRGWSIERALTTPAFEGRRIEHDGRTQNVSAWSRETGIAIATLLKRLDAGWTTERALTTPLCSRGRKKISQPAELRAYRDMERMMIGFEHDLKRALATLIEAHMAMGKALEQTGCESLERLRSRMRLPRGVVPNILKEANDRTHSTAQETMQLGKFK